jgi:SHS family lactate transporter-like MFS transporter
MIGFNFFSHGSQDLYPVYLQTTKGFSSFDASKATIISNVGAIIGTPPFSFKAKLMTRWYDCRIRFPICRSTSSVSCTLR